MVTLVIHWLDMINQQQKDIWWFALGKPAVWRYTDGYRCHCSAPRVEFPDPWNYSQPRMAHGETAWGPVVHLSIDLNGTMRNQLWPGSVCAQANEPTSGPRPVAEASPSSEVIWAMLMSLLKWSGVHSYVVLDQRWLLNVAPGVLVWNPWSEKTHQGLRSMSLSSVISKIQSVRPSIRSLVPSNTVARGKTVPKRAEFDWWTFGTKTKCSPWFGFSNYLVSVCLVSPKFQCNIDQQDTMHGRTWQHIF